MAMNGRFEGDRWLFPDGHPLDWDAWFTAVNNKMIGWDTTPFEPLTDDQTRELNGTKPRRYTIVFDGQAIRCETCEHVSFNPNDIREKYCGLCRAYHDEDDRPGRQREIVETIEARNFDPIRGKPPAPVFAGIPDYVMKYIMPPWLRNKT